MIEWLLSRLDTLAGRWLDWHESRYLSRCAVEHPEIAELNLRKVEVDGYGWNIVMHAPALMGLAAEAAALLEAENAQNHIIFDMMPRLDRGLKPIRVTVAWAVGRNPAEINGILRSAVERIASTYGPLETAGSMARKALRECGYEVE